MVLLLFSLLCVCSQVKAVEANDLSHCSYEDLLPRGDSPIVDSIKANLSSLPYFTGESPPFRIQFFPAQENKIEATVQDREGKISVEFSLAIKPKTSRVFIASVEASNFDGGNFTLSLFKAIRTAVPPGSSLKFMIEHGKSQDVLTNLLNQFPDFKMSDLKVHNAEVDRKLADLSSRLEVSLKERLAAKGEGRVTVPLISAMKRAGWTNDFHVRIKTNRRDDFHNPVLGNVAIEEPNLEIFIETIAP